MSGFGDGAGSGEAEEATGAIRNQIPKGTTLSRSKRGQVTEVLSLGVVVSDWYVRHIMMAKEWRMD